jgi:hypothetical protein
MPPLKTTVGVAIGALSFALAIFVLLSMPGLVSDVDSVRPLAPARGADR